MTAREHLSYNKSPNTLTLKSLSPENANVIKIEKGMVSAYTYHPSQTIYTGATSGSVHMGGFHTEEAYYSPQSQSSGKYRLVYNGISLSDKYCPIDKINLVYPSLIRVAEMDATVRQFLKSDGTLVLSHEPTSQRDLGYLKYMDTAAAMGAMSLLGAERALTKNECQAIKDWISAGARSGSETQGEVQDWEQVAQEKAVLLQYYQEMLDRGIIMREKFDEKVRKIVE